MKNLALVLFLIISVWQLSVAGDRVKLGSGVTVREAPKQKNLSGYDRFEFRDYQLSRLAKFKIKAKVLAKKEYYSGREADLSPVDFALGWQNMSDERVLKRIDISQSNRWYHWRTKRLPIPRKEIETQSANMHMIPANDQIERILNKVKEGQIISILGSLVRIDSDDGWRWISSLTRNDTGARSCEVVYVEKITIIR